MRKEAGSGKIDENCVQIVEKKKNNLKNLHI